MSDCDLDGRGRPRMSTDCLVGSHKKRAECSPKKIVPGQYGHSMVLPTETTDRGLHVDPMHQMHRGKTDHTWQNPPKFEPPHVTGLILPSQGLTNGRTGLQEDPLYKNHKVPGLKELVGERTDARQTGLHVDPLHGQHITRLAPNLPSPVIPDVTSPGHIADHERLNVREVTFTQQEQQRRQQAREAQAMKYAQRRDANFNREQERWESMDAKRTLEDQRAVARVNKTEFHKNDHSVPYNPVTTEYHRTSKGAALQQADHVIREKAAQRAETIQQRSYSQPYNPITGEPIVPVTARLANTHISDGGRAASPARSSMSNLSQASDRSHASGRSSMPNFSAAGGRAGGGGGYHGHR